MHPIALLIFSPPKSKQSFWNVHQIMSLDGEVIMSVPPGRGSLGPKNIGVKFWPWSARLYESLISGDRSNITSSHSVFHSLLFFENASMVQFQDLVLAVPYAWSTLPTDVYESLPHVIQVWANVTGLCHPVQHPFNSLPLTLLVPLYSCQRHLASYVLLWLVFGGLPTTT